MLDQIARILKGTPVNIKLAKWGSGETEYRFSTGDSSKEYLEFVKKYKGDIDEENCFEYDYDEGIAP